MKTILMIASVVAGMPGSEIVDTIGGGNTNPTTTPAAPMADAMPETEGYPSADPIAHKPEYGYKDMKDVMEEHVDVEHVENVEHVEHVDMKPSYGYDDAEVDPVHVEPSYGYEDIKVDPVHADPIKKYEEHVQVWDDEWVDEHYSSEEEIDIDPIILDDWLATPHGEPHGTIPMPHPTHPIDPCQSYADSDYTNCGPHVDPVDLPVCTVETQVHHETQTTGTPECLTTTQTETQTSVCDTTTTCITETATHTSECDAVTTTVTIPTSTKTTCIGTKTADPLTIHIHEYDYQHTYIHPTTYSTSTSYVHPEPTYKTEHDSTLIKVTETSTIVKHDSTTVKVTPTMTVTEPGACATEEVYKTITMEPVYETVKKTIYVPHGCVDPIDHCDNPVEVDPIHVDEKPSYGYEDTQVDPIHVDSKPSYGYEDTQVDPTHVDSKPSYGNVDPIHVDPTEIYPTPSYSAEDPMVDPTELYPESYPQAEPETVHDAKY